MKSYLPILAVLFAAGAADAAEPGLADACIRAAAVMSVAPSVFADVVQEFPELTPPRAKIRFRFSDKPDSQVAFLTCKFKKNSKPFGLVELCTPTGCSSNEGKGRDTFLEVSTILARDGY